MTRLIVVSIKFTVISTGLIAYFDELCVRDAGYGADCHAQWIANEIDLVHNFRAFMVNRQSFLE